MEDTIDRPVSLFWELSVTERRTLLFLRRVARVCRKPAIFWDDDINPAIGQVIDRHVRQRAMYQAGTIDFDPDDDPPLVVTIDGQVEFMEALASLRDKGWIWEKIVHDSDGMNMMYKPRDRPLAP
ncbi:hypothetical protein A2501_02295 [Candidatus Uhrbacteria bacterium RIFOXYC12_FULL_57_11]|nr:MAG: hypothetical protein A2501_02295 [Candidatus Uhrbacteria bacterium RIFOXYC12_FULL_57_11]